MTGKKMRMRRLAACALAAALALGSAAMTLATPTVAEAYPSTATKPKQLKSELSRGESDVIQLSGGKDYWFAGTVDIDHYEVEGGTKENPTRLYFTNSSSLGGPLTVNRDLAYSQHPLFVLKGGYVEFIGDSGTSTEVRCNGKTFLSDSNDYRAWGGADKPDTGKSLDLTVKNLKLVSKTDKYEPDRAITLYGTMGNGETASFTNVDVSGWKCCENSAFVYCNIASTYEASPAPVTIRGSRVAVDATFTNCTFKNNTDDCVGALSVVGRAKTPKVTLNGCTFENNRQGMIACDEMKVESGHVHAGNIAVKNANVVMNNCTIRSSNDTSWSGPCSYMFTVCDTQYWMHMTSAISVAKDASCTINDTVIDDLYAYPSNNYGGRDISGQDEKRCAVYALGSVTLVGNTKVTTTKAKGVDASDVGSYGKIHVDESFTGEAALSIDDSLFDSESNKQYYYEYVNLGTSDLSQEDLASRLKLANADVVYEVTDGNVKVIHRKHEHEWGYSINKDGYSIAATCNGQYEPSQCVYSRDGDTISLMSSKSGDLSFTYNGKQRDAVLDTTKPSQKDSAVAQGKVKITNARFYRCVDENDAVGIEMEGSQPCDAGIYRVVATVAIEGQSDVTLERVFKIARASLVEKDASRNDLCKVEIVGYDKLKDNVRFSNGDVRNGVPSYKWTGEEVTPRIKVTYKLGDEWVELKEGIDFERFPWGESVSEKDPGAYRSQVWGLGNFIYGPFFYWNIYGTQFENVQAKGYEGPYDGEAHVASVNVDNAPEGTKIEYSEDAGKTWSETAPSYTDATRDDEGNLCAKTVKYRVTADDYVTVEGEVAIEISPADQAAPEGITTVAPTAHGLKTGWIQGVNSACEWKPEGESDYRAIGQFDSKIMDLPAGSYNIRLKADKNHNASEDVTVTIEDGPKKPARPFWESDEKEHWKTCTCGKEKLELDAHDFEWIVDKEPTADKPGSKHRSCKVCYYDVDEEVEIPAFGITGYSGTYDGKEHGVTVDTEKVASIEYREEGAEEWSDVSPQIKDAGTKTVEFRATLKSGDNATGTVTLEVEKRLVGIVIRNASKTYGDADPAFRYELNNGRLVEGESLSGINLVRKSGEDVVDGGYAITASIDQGADPNYSVAVVANGKLTITKREVTLKWGTTQFVYDGEKKCPEATLVNAVANDDVAVKVVGASEKVGSHTARVTGITGDKAGNYKLLETGLTCDFTIKKAPQGAPVVQPHAETVNGKHDGSITGVDPTMEWRFKGSGDYQAVPECVYALEQMVPDTYEIRYRADDNHEASPATEVTVEKGRMLVLTLPSEQEGYTLEANKTELYWKGTAKLTFKLAEGYHKTDAFAVKVNGTAVALDGGGRASITAMSDLQVTVEGVEAHKAVGNWVTDEGAHWHVCSCGEVLGKADHTFEWIIDRKPTATEAGSKHRECAVCGYRLDPVEIPAASVAGYSGEYDGAYHTVDTSNLPKDAAAEYSTDGGKTWTSEAPKIKDAGSLTVAYKVTIDGTAVEGEVTLEVAPRKLTVAAKSAQKVYGEADPELGYEVREGSLVEGESLDGISVTREAGESVRAGDYVISVSQEKGANANYDIAFEFGVFTIAQRTLTVTWGTSEFVYSGDAKAPTVALGGVLKGDKVTAAVDGAATDAGSYTATVTGLAGDDAGNYALPAEGLTCPFVIKNAAQGVPAAEASAETVSGKQDGKIQGVDGSMEWRAKGDADFRDVDEGATELTGLASGTYQIRYKAKANHDASAVVEVTVAAGRKLQVSLPAGQVGYALLANETELDWHGTSTLTFTLADGYFAGPDFAVKVNGEKVELTDGVYVLSNVEADANVTVEGVLAHEADGAGWKSDASGHWRDCVCGAERLDAASHDFEVVVDTVPTACAPGVGHEVCRVCGATGKTDVEIPMLDLAIVEGAGQKLVAGAGKELTVRSNAPFDAFVGVKVDGVTLDPASYDAHEGSTVVALHANYLATLGEGEHTLSVVSLRAGQEAEAKTTFTIEKAGQPATPEAPGSGATVVEKDKPTPAAKKPVLPEAGDGSLVAAGFVLAAGSVVLLAAATARRRNL